MSEQFNSLISIIMEIPEHNPKKPQVIKNYILEHPKCVHETIHNTNELEIYTPGHFAAYLGYHVSLNAIFEAATIIDKSIDSQSRYHVDLLLNTVAALIPTDEDESVETNGFGKSPVWFAADNGHLKCLHVLHKAGCNMEQINYVHLYETPIFGAVKNGHLDCVKFFHEIGCNLDFQNETKNTPIMIATLKKHLKCISFLYEVGCDLKLENDDGETITHWFAGFAKYHVMKGLHERGCDMEKQDKYGNTPAHYAVGSNNFSCLYFLYEIGCNLSYENFRNETPLEYANSFSKIVETQECVEFLQTLENTDETCFIED